MYQDATAGLIGLEVAEPEGVRSMSEQTPSTTKKPATKPSTTKAPQKGRPG
jgi:hypothetical protein